MTLAPTRCVSPEIVVLAVKPQTMDAVLPDLRRFADAGAVFLSIAAGKTLEQTQADGLPEKWKSWAVPTLSTQRWIEILYKGLKKQP